MAAFAVVCGATLAAQQQPTFRSDIALVQLDVRVVDDDGRFVRDLTSSDLQIFEDGQRQTISAFALVDIPIAGGVRQPMAVPSDVVTNASAGQGRLFVLVLDDLNTHPLRGVTIRELAKCLRRSQPRGRRSARADHDRRQPGSHPRIHREP